MRRIDRYIQKNVLLAMLVVMALTTSVNLVFAVADELGGTGENYTVMKALIYVLRTTPTSIYDLLPFTALGGALIGLGILASNNELVVIQTAGVKTWRVVWAAMKPTLLVMLLSLLLGEYVAPQLEQQAASDKAVQRSGDSVIRFSSGSWQRLGNEFIHINAILPGGEQLIGVTRYRLDSDRRLASSSFAANAQYVNDGDGGYWQLFDVVETLILPGQIQTQSYLQRDWQVNLPPELLSVLLVEPQQQPISGLYRFAGYFDAQGLEADSYYLAFWKKLLQPVSTAVLVLLAISFVFGPLREATMGLRIFVAISIGLVFTIIQRLLEPFSLLYGLSPLLAVLLPIAACLVLGGVLMQRVR
ncbi:MAG: LPS export ABC transporter permease LptG [Gammaproteobacteria bacterium]|nr:LPS export ABC transporter permease LptG [Pseudomonadales bacterium]MCP5346701.1 LPS export ABC transporter permease LptG [Pseudomonadales bacterium]